MPLRMLNLLKRSINDANRLAKAGAGALVFLLLCCFGVPQSVASPGNWPELRFSADAVEFRDIRLSQVGAALAEDGSFELSFQRLQGSGESYAGTGLLVEGVLRELRLADDAVELRSELRARGLSAELTLVSQAGRLQADLVAEAQPFASLRSFEGLPPELEWVNGGAFDLGPSHPPLLHRWGAGVDAGDDGYFFSVCRPALRSNRTACHFIAGHGPDGFGAGAFNCPECAYTIGLHRRQPDDCGFWFCAVFFAQHECHYELGG